ncbi:hypothetical protein [Streptomyces sp. NPDC018031]|uniref:hypothetical protein n=1 Tax=Streptomyces sp. NPDC018031 TaxID=3365033 RepID=UPI0037A6B897
MSTVHQSAVHRTAFDESTAAARTLLDALRSGGRLLTIPTHTPLTRGVPEEVPHGAGPRDEGATRRPGTRC